MPNFHLVEGDATQEQVIEWVHRISQLVSTEIHGEDQAGSLESTQVSSHDSPSRLVGIILALPGPVPQDAPLGRFGLPVAPAAIEDVWGCVTFRLPLQDNQHLVANVFPEVRSDQRRQGIGTAMLTQLRRIASKNQRDTVGMASEHRTTASAEPVAWLEAPQGTGRVPLDAASTFAQSQGFRLAQVERQSRLQLPVEPTLLTTLTAEAERVAGADYHLVSWAGPTPPEYLELAVAANHAISVDAPSGELDIEPESWDAARVKEDDRRMAVSGTAFHTLAFTRDNEPAGLTTIFVERGVPEHGYQFNTVVLRNHRGHRLGLWMKAVNLAAVTIAHPELSHIDTWNADENQHMLAINGALGFRPWAVCGEWQLKLD